MPWRTCAITITVAIFSVAGASAQQQPVTLEQLLSRATVYVEGFVSKFSRVVAEEQYVQDYLEVVAGAGGIPQLRERRRLRSDVLRFDLRDTGTINQPLLAISFLQ